MITILCGKLLFNKSYTVHGCYVCISLQANTSDPTAQQFLSVVISFPEVLLKLTSVCGLRNNSAEILANAAISVSVFYLVL